MSATVEPAWLEQRLGDASVRVIEASIARASFTEAHVPGAAWVDFHGDLLRNGDDTSGLVPTPEQYAALMGRLGVAPWMDVVWYGDRHNSYATRGLWMMTYYRHPGSVYVLAGGRERWLAEGRPTEAGDAVVRETDYPLPPEPDDADRASWRDVRDAIADDGAVILDVRALDEYDGTSVRAKRGGHIPGAVHIEWTDATAGANVLKSAQELRAIYEARGVTPDKRIIAHCQLGVRASHTWFVLKHVLGYPDVRNYDGSWREWGDRDDLPVET